MDKEQVFIRELGEIHDQNIEKLVCACLKKIPDEFFTAPASSTGKYHPQYALGLGGLVRHTKAAVLFAKTLLGLEMFSALKPMQDEIIAALILHDCCKNGRNWNGKFTTVDHPLQASAFVQDIANELCVGDFPYVSDIRKLIECHMGQWTTDFNGNQVLEKPQTQAQKFVHICDYLASRKFLSVSYEDGNPL